MELESLVMAELNTMDLNGVRVLNLSCRGDATDISFEVGDMKIDFTTTGGNNYQIMALTHGGTVYTDPATLSKCNDWVQYVSTVVNPIVEKHRAELERQRAGMDMHRVDMGRQNTAEHIAIPSTVGFDELKGPPQMMNDDPGMLAGMPSMGNSNMPNMGNSNMPNMANSNMPSLSNSMPNSNMPNMANSSMPSLSNSMPNSNMPNENIDDVIDRGRKEGYKAARKKNIQEVKKLKRKHLLMTIFIVVILTGVGLVLLYLYQAGDIYLPDLYYMFSGDD